MSKIESIVVIVVGVLVAAISIIVDNATEKNFVVFSFVGFGMIIYGIYTAFSGRKKPKKKIMKSGEEIVKKIPGSNYKFNPNIFFCKKCGKAVKTGTKQCANCGTMVE